MPIPFTTLNVGFSNAENYRRKENKELLQKYFVKDDFLDRLLDHNVYFLIGEKGTGKTAYATYLTNNKYKDYQVSTYDVRQTEYQKFLELKRQGYLALSQYSEVWRTLLLITAATSVLALSNAPEFLKRFTKLNALKRALDEFYENAFAPEIVKIINFVESSELATSLIAKYSGIEGKTEAKHKAEQKDSSSVFQINLLKIRQAFETALAAVKLDDDMIIFIDGIDVRPSNISYSDYFDCVRGLIDAVWSVNNDFLANIKDSKGRIRIVVLVRPDIFLRTGLHNLNTKLRDNSVFLNWSTTYKDYRSSLLFKVADRLLAAQQVTPVIKTGEMWDYYFPFHAENVRSPSVSDEAGVNSFLAFLRFSYYRPRDISAMIGTIQEIIKRKREFSEYVTAEDFNDPSFRDAHAEYLLGEIRDQLLFYYSQEEYDLFLQFFSHLKGKRKFTYNDFIEAFNEFITECAQQKKDLPKFFESASTFLQFLYEQNVVCYKEEGEHDNSTTEIKSKNNKREQFIRWCFRERTFANMAPKVRLGVEYEIFYGLSKSLNVGRPVRVRKAPQRKQIGTIATLKKEEGFGFIRGGDQHLEYYFKVSEFVSDKEHLLRIGQKVSFEVEIKYAKPRARAVKPIR